ncbi:hypothetical protein M407DRAFT_155166 [Tulasnella calospora MUT 4182]|uniref:Uncharacterized protein n=1 Tax=Tulasnella calospora MUT 4182 TaxID=1051891 RepID=A0A0C3QPP1_9AGAM|nr:hypothetical protein M407DRAFT_155166 [Tulasnella calospora MUT 4182]
MLNLFKHLLLRRPTSLHTECPISCINQSKNLQRIDSLTYTRCQNVRFYGTLSISISVQRDGHAVGRTVAFREAISFPFRRIMTVPSTIGPLLWTRSRVWLSRAYSK